MWVLFFFVANELKEVANDIIFGNSLKGIINNNYYCVFNIYVSVSYTHLTLPTKLEV